MKANKAPEKIILSADRETGTLYDEWSIKDTTDNIKIEYIRADSIGKKDIDFNFGSELYKAFGQVKDFTLCIRIARHFYELGLKTKEDKL